MPHVTFVHGIANKPPKDDLLDLWQRSISKSGSGLNLGANGISTSMVYWADVLYAEPWRGSGFESVASNFETNDSDEHYSWREQLGGAELSFVQALEQRVGLEPGDDTMDETSPDESEYEALSEPTFEAIPLPGFIKRRLMKRFVRDTHHYLFNVSFSPRPGETYQVKDEIRNRFVEQLSADQSTGGPHVIVGHSMGSVIAYDCLKNVAECDSVDALLTIGSPLGLSEVQNELGPGYSEENGYPQKAPVWQNFYDRLDPVALDARLSNDYKRNGVASIIDQRVANSGLWRHTATKYLEQNAFINFLKHIFGL